ATARDDREGIMLKQSTVGTDSVAQNEVPLGLAPVPASNGIAGSLKSVLDRWPRVMNVALLIAGLGLGQGSIFAVQTLLVARGEYELLAAFGTHYSFALLGIILVDMGASTILARTVAHLSGERASRDEVWLIFCETCVIRLLAASLIGAGG